MKIEKKKIIYIHTHTEVIKKTLKSWKKMYSIQYGSDKRVGRDHVNEKYRKKRKRKEGFWVQGIRALGHQDGGSTAVDFTFFNN